MNKERSFHLGAGCIWGVWIAVKELKLSYQKMGMEEIIGSPYYVLYNSLTATQVSCMGVFR